MDNGLFSPPLTDSLIELIGSKHKENKLENNGHSSAIFGEDEQIG
jgi:hypothetical protein